MADQPRNPHASPGDTPSGSRWEPGPDETPTSESTPTTTDGTPIPVGPPPADASYDVPGVAGPVPPEDPAAADRRAQLRGRAVLAGAATALTLGGGLAGFVIGHNTAGDSTNGFRPANFSGQQPGQLGEGQQGPPSFDRDGDGDHLGQQPPDFDGDGNGSSQDGSGSGTSANPT